MSVDGVDTLLESKFSREVRVIAERVNDRIGRDGDGEALLKFWKLFVPSAPAEMIM